jgi:pimeloyl-ACP methyl ester carboxylesterase
MSGLFILNARTRARGGPLRPIEESSATPEGFRTLTVWIHGFNNSKPRITETWDKAVDVVRKRNGMNNLDGLVWYFWPGDTFRYRPLSMAAYFTEVGDAVTAGRYLADYLTGIAPRNPDLSVNIVAHSLGCRVALEAAIALKELSGPSVGKLLLFAAAVPEGLCVPGQPYGGDLADKVTVLWSNSDRVLRRSFLVGQAMARRFRNEIDPGEQREAVGYAGGPPQRWHGERWSCGLGHGDYWKPGPALDRLAELFRESPRFRLPRERPARSRSTDQRVLVRRPTGIRRPRRRK